MSDAPEPPKIPEQAAPTSRSSTRSLVVRVVVSLGLVVVALGVLWQFLGQDAWQEFKQYREELRAAEDSAPIGYIGLNYRKEYNSRPPRFHFEEDDRKLLFASIGDGETPEFYDVTDAQFDPQDLQGGFGRDSIPGIDYPIFDRPDSELGQALRSRQDMAGLVLDSGPRAYPVDVVAKIEVVNDTDGDTPFVLVFDRGADAVLTYSRNLDGQAITFGTTGYATTSSKKPLLYDRMTQSLWLPEADGLRCVNGELVGQTLPPFRSVDRVTWNEWKRQHPNTLILFGNDREQPIPSQ